MKIITIKKGKEESEKENLSIPPVKGDGEKNKKRWEEEVKKLRTIVDYLKDEQNKNPSQSNQDKLDKAKDKLKDLENNPPLSPDDNKNKNNSSPNQPFSPKNLIIGGIVLVVIGGIIFLAYKSKKKNN